MLAACGLIACCRSNPCLYGYDYLLNYTAQNHSVVVNARNIVVKKAEKYEFFGHALRALFNPRPAAIKQIFDLFAGHNDSLEKAHMVHIKADKNTGHYPLTLPSHRHMPAVFANVFHFDLDA